MKNMQILTSRDRIGVRPMSRADYNLYRGWTMPEGENGADAGYLVEYTGGKQVHPAHAGHITWLPKAQVDATCEVVPPSTFQMVSAMNTAFGNPQGDPYNIDWNRVRNQFKNVGHEFVELMNALGADTATTESIVQLIDGLEFVAYPDLDKVRDASRDVVVFADGGHHFMGYDADVDMKTVIDGVMTRFVKDEADLLATQAKHFTKGVLHVYTEGNYPTMILKSAADQPDAPKGKFLKSASYKEPVFYQIAPKQ